MRPTTDPRGEDDGRLPPLRALAAPGGRHARFGEARDGPRRRSRAPEIKNVRIERGDRPRAISRRTDGAGDCYTPIRDANGDQIRDSDLIHPGQVLVLRGEDTIDAARTGSAPEETATMIQFTKIVTYVVAAMAALTLVLVVLQTTSMLAGS